LDEERMMMRAATADEELRIIKNATAKIILINIVWKSLHKQ
jgi:hypothetical protein